MTYRIVSQLTENKISELVDLYKNEFWSSKRTHQDVVRMLAESDIIIAFVDENEKVIGFTRILTDFVYRAIIFDVIIKPSHRNMKLSSKLMDAVVNHPQLKSIEWIALCCLPEMIPYYERWGFTSELGKMQLMFRINQNNDN
ncbi:GNAT family N-acetyltransferase [Plectonema radiosum NIES-515]|uniref:GNAT family N-acetyltransferase n=1 Tax=Plectonema radiosum NIES-515 TaxID=2986073 RepID=A0ABT3B846_9CYAN|nr:GNAT family N-acetyltransferase [Plectonema radiosum]MCV3217543.1 GNAT family N-acetyltransferase [Plectonema radiosum NIES-515]